MYNLFPKYLINEQMKPKQTHIKILIPQNIKMSIDEEMNSK